MNHINLDMKNDEEEKNILLGLVKEGLISLDELSENRLKEVFFSLYIIFLELLFLSLSNGFFIICNKFSIESF